MNEGIQVNTPGNRNRNHSTSVRFTKAEYDYFHNQFIKSNEKSHADFLLRLLEEKPITVITDLVPLRAELKRIGTNINQIARVLNASFYDDNTKIDNDLLSKLKDTTKELNNVLFLIERKL